MVAVLSAIFYVRERFKSKTPTKLDAEDANTLLDHVRAIRRAEERQADAQEDRNKILKKHHDTVEEYMSDAFSLYQRAQRAKAEEHG